MDQYAAHHPPTDSSRSELSVTEATDQSSLQAMVSYGTIPDSIVLQIKNKNEKVEVDIKNLPKGYLDATLIAPGALRNLRINQIVMPDGKTDGPFGRKLHYTVTQTGDYKLLIGKDNMADGTMEGPAKLFIRVQKQ